ncbi:MAG TPA: hypothetical protein VEK38_01000 [Candidatus Bathyarchaeia archaeon]|nr:hypothetical protein [Candidatus Bathyarchaeia archaeon]
MKRFVHVGYVSLCFSTFLYSAEKFIVKTEHEAMENSSIRLKEIQNKGFELEKLIQWGAETHIDLVPKARAILKTLRPEEKKHLFETHTIRMYENDAVVEKTLLTLAYDCSRKVPLCLLERILQVGAGVFCGGMPLVLRSVLLDDNAMTGGKEVWYPHVSPFARSAYIFSIPVNLSVAFYFVYNAMDNTIGQGRQAAAKALYAYLEKKEKKLSEKSIKIKKND